MIVDPLDQLLDDAGVTVEPVTRADADIARQAYRDFGKGSRHGAALNFGDCFAYALARSSREPLLFKGNDFSRTDVMPAIRAVSPMPGTVSPGHGLTLTTTEVLMLFSRSKSSMPGADAALPGQASRPYPLPDKHAVLGNPLEGPFPEGLEVAVFGMGCFWGAERIFWQTPGVWSTAAGYSGGLTSHPTYEQVCSGLTGHAEIVQVVYDPDQVSYEQLLKIFWESHDPTQGYRQGNDLGTQYRSAIYTTTPEQQAAAEKSRAAYGELLRARRYGDITTEIRPAGDVYLAEDYHQQYLYKVPNGYCGISGTGVSCPVGIATAE